MSIAAEGEAAAESISNRRTSPYQGLVPYGEEDAEWFFGRDESRDVVIDSLRAYRVSVLYGESGVGKSSLLRASVLTYLRGEASADTVAVAFADWALEDPLTALKQTVRRQFAELQDYPPSATLADILAACSTGVDGGIFLILDQFEELFLYHAADEAGRAFEGELVEAIRRRDGAANFLLSIREDALAKLDRLQVSIPGLLDNLLRLEHLDEPAAREAIERPLEHWNDLESAHVSIEPALVEQVLVEVETGSLLAQGAGGAGRIKGGPREGKIQAPYLQLVLARIWSEERAAGSDVLRLDTLNRLGGAERIVRTHLDRVLSTLSRRDRRVAASAFRYLVTPSGTKIAHRPPDLAAYAEVPLERLTRVLNTLAGDARILRPVADGAYEIYHDALAAAVLDWRRRYQESRARGLLGRSAVLGGASAAVAIMIVAYLGHVLGGLENRTVDARFSIRGARVPADVAVVGVDDATFEHLRVQWPFPRSLHGRVIDRLRRDGAKVIAFDVQFTEPTKARQDNALITAIERAGDVVLATAEVDSQGHTNVLGGDSTVRQVHAHVGNSTLPTTSGGVVRHVPWGTGSIDPATGKPGGTLESFGLVATEVATKRQITPSEVGHLAPIDYAGRPGTIPKTSYWRVLQGRFKPGTFRGKIVVVGAVASSLQDVHVTPVGGLMSGPELQANSVETALRGFPLNPRKALDIALIALLGFVVAVANLRFGWKANLAIALAAGAGYVLAVQLAFNGDTLLPFVYPLLALVLTTAFMLIWSFRTRRRA